MFYFALQDSPLGADEKPINTRTTAKSMDKEEPKQPQEHASPGSEHAATGGGDNFPITLVEPYQSDHPDSSTAAHDDTLSIEGSIPLEPVPSMDVTPVETEDNNDAHSEVESTQKISLRKSIDSDPGDFVKIETADNGGSDAAAVEVKPATPPVVVSSTSAEEKKEVEVPKPEQKKEEKVEQPVQKVEEKPKPKPEEKAEKKAEAKPGDKSPAASLLTWIHENPGMVRCCAATAAVVGVAGIGCFVYARRIRSGGV
ncbi:hypothetical protein ANCCAN_04782 [Ancylostoma caninum]|uniref:Uncharacterized protein n=1 Tax=Ancylostoma caninum TaxID=29170 RepID=A0A368H0S8_ANCCA|nr:hypothetical protein ANCCAN_04782 [Ancylostoma caninum]